MLPLFKTHHSIGKSLLTPEKCFELAKGYKEIVFVEDSMSGFRKINKLSEKTGISLRFGLRFALPDGKIIVFAKNSEGIKELKKLYTSFAYDEFELPNSKNLLIVIPFYDSYIHYNIHNFGVAQPPGNFIHFAEDNDHPFDFQIRRKIKDLGIVPVEVKSIYYEKEEDFLEYQFIRAVSKRGGKNPSVSNPNLNHCGSDQFSFESYERR